MLARYAPSQGKLFGDSTGTRAVLRQAVAEDLLLLVSRFADEENVRGRSSYQAMERVLREQCDVAEQTVQLKKKTGGEVMQNPSDGDATYDGHKGPGYQVQIAETCSGHNEVQLITGVEVEPAHRSDQDAAVPMIDQLEAHDRRPELLYADGQYGSDANVVDAAQRGVDLQSPVTSIAQRMPDALTIDDFVVDEKTQTVQRCPNGREPAYSVHDVAKGRTRTVMEASHCSACPFANQCPVKQVRGEYVIEHTPAQQRLASRRAEQATDAFGENYAIRGGGESVNAGLKRKMGMGRLRVRRLPRVRMAVLLRCAGWNLLRALAALKQRGIGGFAAFLDALASLESLLRRLKPWIEVWARFGPRKIAPEQQTPMLAAA